MNDIIGLILIAIGLGLDLLACIGLMRLPDVYNRLQVSTKCVTLGTSLILIGMFFIVGFKASGVKALLCMAFVVLTAPVAAHAIARGAHKAGVKLSKESVVDMYIEDREGR